MATQMVEKEMKMQQLQGDVTKKEKATIELKKQVDGLTAQVMKDVE